MCYFSREEIHALVEEAHRLGRRVAGHIYGGLGADWALEAGIDTIEHGSYLSDEQLRIMASRGAWLVATLGVYLIDEDWADVPEWAQEKAREAQLATREVFQKAMECAVKITFGADCHHEPFRMVKELALAAQLGMPKMDVIVNATAGAAKACGLECEVGQLVPGQLADLLIVTGDPLQSIHALKSITAVMQAGKLVRL